MSRPTVSPERKNKIAFDQRDRVVLRRYPHGKLGETSETGFDFKKTPTVTACDKSTTFIKLSCRTIRFQTAACCVDERRLFETPMGRRADYQAAHRRIATTTRHHTLGVEYPAGGSCTSEAFALSST